MLKFMIFIQTVRAYQKTVLTNTSTVNKRYQILKTVYFSKGKSLNNNKYEPSIIRLSFTDNPVQFTVYKSDKTSQR